MIPSKSSVISSLVTAAVLSIASPVKAFIMGAFIAPMPLFFFGLIMDPYPSKVAIISSLIVIGFNYFEITWWYGVIVAVVVGTSVDIWRKARIKA